MTGEGSAPNNISSGEKGDGSPQVDVIVERFGGIRPMAAKLGIPVTTVQGWKKRGTIPPNRRADLETAAARLGISLTAAELDAAMGAPEPVAPAAPAIALPSPGTSLATQPTPFLSAPGSFVPKPDAKPEPKPDPAPRIETFRTETKADPFKPDPAKPEGARPAFRGDAAPPPRPPQAPPTVVKRGGAVSALALLVALAALGAGGYSLWRGGALDPALIRLGLAPVGGVSAEPAPAADYVGTQTALAEVGRRLSAAAQRQQALEQEVADLKAKLAAAPAAATGDGAPAADPALAARLDQMTEQFTRLTDRQRALEQALAQSAQQREELSARLAAQNAAAGRGQALLVATNQLQAALVAGRPYDVELSAVRSLAPDDDALRQILDRLAQTQGKGLAGPLALRDGFDRAADAAQRAARVPEGADWLEQLWGRLKALVTIRRKDGHMEGNEPDAVVSRAGAALDRGDLGTAVAEMSALAGPPAATPEVQAWLRDAQARLAADDAMTRLSRRAVSDVQGGLPPAKEQAKEAPKDGPAESLPLPENKPEPPSAEGAKPEGQPDGATPQPAPAADNAQDGGHL
ncbi:MAG: mitofilin family membrane protein [Azospirillaceae bacterium]|nr:mitofilin family membrane protein [Azospirillaceae bacterium]